MEEKDYFDFKEDASLTKSFTEDYLRQYYHPDRPITDDEKATFEFIRKITPKLPLIPSCLEVGCGPTLHHALMIAPLVQSLELSDYLEENLAFVDAWLNGAPNAWDWSAYAQYCLQEEGEDATSEKIKARLALTRKLISKLRSINVLSPHPLEVTNLQYDLVATFYCTEEVAITKDRWREVMRSITTLIKPGGFLLMSCLENTNYYHIKNPDGSPKALPCAPVTETDLHEVLDHLGYDLSESIIEVRKTPEQIHEGVNGVLSTLARLKK